MNHCSYFIKDKALFGSFPSQESVKELEENGVRYFINLTQEGESRTNPYTTEYKYIVYPIQDRTVPEDILSFCKFVVEISRIIKNSDTQDKIYIHCRAGYSRSPMVTASILCYLFHMLPSESLQYTSKCHSNRSIMKDKWRRMDAPHSYIQKKLIYKLFQPINVNKIFKTGILNFKIVYEEKEYTHIFYAIDEYKKKIEEKEWEQVKDKVMYKIMKKNIDNNEEIKETLIKTYLRPIQVYLYNYSDNYWSTNKHNGGKNKLGKVLNEIRLNYLMS